MPSWMWLCNIMEWKPH